MNVAAVNGERKSANRVTWIYAAALAVATLAAYSRVGSFEYLHYDDTLYVTKNPFVLSGLSFQNVRWAFTTFDVANWQPLTWISHMADVSMFGQSARGPHYVNVLIHLANTLLLFWIIRRMTQAEGRAALIAALFAVHPSHVESVAWIAERKDVLSTLFGMLALAAYALYSERRNPIRYGAVLIFFAMSLMAKAMWVTFPFLLLLIDYWPVNRFATSSGKTDDLRRRIGWAALEKVPLLALAIGSSVVTMIAQSRSGAVATMEQSALLYRLANAVDGYAQYVGMFFVPYNLTAFYPHPGTSISMPRVAVEAVILLAITLAVFAMWKKRPHTFVGWSWFLGTLVPVIGIVHVGSQAYADRYSYLPSIGLSIAVVWLAGDVARQLKVAPTVMSAVAVLITLVMAAMTWVQSGYWRDDETLWRHAVSVTEGNYRAHANLGHALTRTDQDAEAIPHFVKAAELYPNNPRTFVGLGNALENLGRIDEAAEAYQKAILIDDKHANAYVNLGALFVKSRRLDDAIVFLERGLSLDPLSAVGHNNLGAVYAMRGDFGLAVQHFEEALRLRPGYVSAEANLVRARNVQRQ